MVFRRSLVSCEWSDDVILRLMTSDRRMLKLLWPRVIFEKSIPIWVEVNGATATIRLGTEGRVFGIIVDEACSDYCDSNIWRDALV